MQETRTPILEHALYHKAWDSYRARAEEVLTAIIGALNLPLVEISLVWHDDAGMRALNHRYRGRDTTTNVLAFPALDLAPDQPISASADALILGDIVLAYERVAQEAERDGISFSAHMAHLLTHGLLHLLGYRHDTQAQALNMQAQETRLLALCGVANPYKGDVHV